MSADPVSGIQGPNVMRGRLNRPEETAKTLAGGWLHTCDIRRFDKDGYLVLVDRAEGVIIRRRENIDPKEIETVVYQLPAIANTVLGRANPVYREEPVLFVALNSEATLTADQILEHARQNLSTNKLPVEITFLDELPNSAVGKLDKPALRRSLSGCGRGG